MAIPIIPHGDVVELISQPIAGALLGSTFALPQTANVISWQHTEAGAPSATSVSLALSLDGISFVTVDTDATIGGSLKTIALNAYRYVRAAVNSRTGGTLTRIMICVQK